MTRFIYRIYRKAKRHFVNNPSSFISRLFFRLLMAADKIMSPRLKPQLAAEQKIWKSVYFLRYGSTPPYFVETVAPVAFDSDDHKWPRGTLYDNSVNRNFNLRLYNYFSYRHDLRVMDLGCSGGGMVKSFLEDGYTAVGLEGSDISKKLRSAEWDTIPYHLFTCDITEPFNVKDTLGNTVKFHCITAWDVLEHIPESKLPELFENIKRHLAPDGIFVCSIDTTPDGNPLTGAVYHVSVHDKGWWLDRFEAAGFCEVERSPFSGKEDFVRGNGAGFKDWDPDDGDGFHLVLKI